MVDCWLSLWQPQRNGNNLSSGGTLADANSKPSGMTAIPLTVLKPQPVFPNLLLGEDPEAGDKNKGMEGRWVDGQVANHQLHLPERNGMMEVEWRYRFHSIPFHLEKEGWGKERLVNPLVRPVNQPYLSRILSLVQHQSQFDLPWTNLGIGVGHIQEQVLPKRNLIVEPVLESWLAVSNPTWDTRLETSRNKTHVLS